jgi:hypothetical protein
MAFSPICDPCNPQTITMAAFLLVIAFQRKTSMPIYTCCMCNNHIRNVKLQSPHHIYSTPITTIQQIQDNINHKIQNQPSLSTKLFSNYITNLFMHVSGKNTCTYVEIRLVATLLVFGGLVFASYTHIIDAPIRNY